MVFYPAQKATDTVSAATLDEIKRHFDTELSAALSKRLGRVTTPGARTLVFTPASTAVTVENQDLAAYEYIPIALIVAGVSTATGMRDQSGHPPVAATRPRPHLPHPLSSGAT